MTHSTPQPVGDRLKHGPLSGQNLALLKAGESVVSVPEDFRTGSVGLRLIGGKPYVVKEISDDPFPVVVRCEAGHDAHWSPQVLTYIGERDADGWVHAPEGGWTENPVPGMRVDAQFKSGGRAEYFKQPWSNIIAFRPATTPATREDGASDADGEREAVDDARVLFESICEFLLGEAPYEGRNFGDAPPVRHGRPQPFWWRTDLREARDAILALRPLSPDQPSARERRLEEALREIAALIDLSPVPCATNFDRGAKAARGQARDIARQALAHNQEGGR